MAIAPGIGDHVDVWVFATVVRIRSSNFKDFGGAARFVYQVMAIGICAPECGAVPGTQRFFAGVRDQS